jgi:hypothetical protein
MADYRSLVIVSGQQRQIADGDRVITPSGIISSASADLELAVYSTGSNSVKLGANSNFSVGAGTSEVDLSGGTGIFKTTTGAVTIGPGTVTVSGASTFTAVGTALTVTNTAQAGALKSPSLDTIVAGTLQLGTSTATAISIGKSGVAAQAPGGVLTPAMDTAAAGALSIGTANATSISIGKAGVGVTTLGGLLSPSVDTVAAGTLALGGTNATAVTIGKVGILTTVLGNLQVDGTETVVGITTFTGDAQFNGNVVFGDADTDTVSVRSVIGNGTYNDIIFSGGNDHVISAAAPGSGAGKTVTYMGGQGVSGATPTVGGNSFHMGGQGGAGTALVAAAAGAHGFLQGGPAGADNGAGGAAGGNAYVRGGAATGVSANGDAYIGDASTVKIWLGSSSGAVPIEQQAGGGAITLRGATSISGGLTLTNYPLTMTGLNIGATAAEIGDIFTDGYIRFGAMLADPTAVAAKGFVYVKPVSGNEELFYRDPTNAPVQITSNGSVNAGTSGTAQQTIVATTAREATALATGEAVYIGLAVTLGARRADANGSTAAQEAIGLCKAGAANGSPIDIVVCGEVATPDGTWDAVPAAADAGKRYYLSENAGKLTMTAPNTSGSVVKKMGTITQGGTGVVKVLVQPADGVLL